MKGRWRRERKEERERRKDEICWRLCREEGTREDVEGKEERKE